MCVIGRERQVRAASIVFHALAIGPPTRVTDSQATVLLNVCGRVGFHALVHHDDDE